MNICAHRPRPRFAVSGASGCLLALLIASGSCRKAEPEEIVTRPKWPQNTGATGAAVGNSSSGGVVGSSGGTTSTPTSGAGGDAATGGTDSGTEPAPVVACEPTVTPLSGPFTKAKLLEAAADCAASVYCKFSRRAQRLRDATAQAVKDSNAKSAARDAWISAMAEWEEADMFRFGPAGSSSQPGGRDLRDLIYSWPVDVRCRVDEQTVSRFYMTPQFASDPKTSFISGRSLAAVEYLLFYAARDNGCTQFSAINAQGTWAALSDSELALRKAEYAAAAADDVLTRAVSLVHGWDASQSSFRSELLRAGNGSAIFVSEQAALNSVAQALFYLDKEVKDFKLAIPLGLDPACTAERCPDRVEARYAQISKAHLSANLRGFRKLFQGCAEHNAGIGFDDWLSTVNMGELAERMLNALDAAENTLAALDLPLEQALRDNPERVEELRAAIKRVTDPLKTELVSALNLELPRGVEGDND